MSHAQRLCRFLYGALWQLALPALLVRAWWRGRREPGYRRHLWERLGIYAERSPSSVIWIHAVSVGEARAAAPLIGALQRSYPDCALRVTCATPAGRDTLRQILGGGAQVTYLPYDAPGPVRRFLSHCRPRLGILMETEIWPNLIAACHRRGIPLLLANARMSKRSARRYARTSLLTRGAIAALDAVCAQGRADARRLRVLGARAPGVTGNLKFDAQPDARQLALGRALRAGLQGRRVLLFASTREGEEALLLDALGAAQAQVHGEAQAHVLVLIVPRHRQRFDEVAALIAARGLRLARRSQTEVPAADCEVFLGDTLGEMALYYGLADVAVIGGSFRPLGGQNLIEACAAGVPVVTGPHMFNFSAATRDALRAGAAIQADTAQAALRTACGLLMDTAALARMAQCALAFSRRHGGATERHLEVCRHLLERAADDAAAAGLRV